MSNHIAVNSYTIRINDADGEHVITSHDQSECELIVKSYILVMLEVEGAEITAESCGAVEAARAQEVLKALRADLRRGSMHQLNLDRLVEDLYSKCFWQTGPHGDPSFTITRMPGEVR